MKTPIVTSALCVLACLRAMPAFPASCERMAALALKETTVTAAQLVSAGQFSAPGGGRGANNYKNLPEFCRVAVTIKPTSDSDIKVEVWLPAAGWNGKFQAVGNGGWAGVISYSAMADAVRAGYASASRTPAMSGAVAPLRSIIRKS
jgi:feruloyl esterase